MESEIEKRIEEGRKAVLSQVDFLHERFGKSESSWKEDETRVTPADLEISEKITEFLAKEFPDDDICSEETDSGKEPIELTKRFAWILDPIDGTNNFALGIPFTSISLGLLKDGVPVYGLVYDFGRRELFHGGQGKGVWCGDEKIERRKGGSGGKKKIVAIGVEVDTKTLPLVNEIIKGSILRNMGSAALQLTYTALGMIDVYMDFKVKIWDIAAACAICEEADTEIKFLQGSPFPLKQFDIKGAPVEFVAGEVSFYYAILKKKVYQRDGGNLWVKK